MRTREKKQKHCKYCNKPIPNRNVYCNNTCQVNYQRDKYITEWKQGKQNGRRGKILLLSRHLMWYLRERSNNECEMCGWSAANQYTGNVPLEVDHIDGDASNNKEENLRLICPNCHSLTPTFRNTGGRSSARVRK